VWEEEEERRLGRKQPGTCQPIESLVIQRAHEKVGDKCYSPGHAIREKGGKGREERIGNS
jgi:hypothetical protein